MSIWLLAFICILIVGKVTVRAVGSSLSGGAPAHHPRQAEWAAACERLGLQTAPPRKNRHLSARGVVDGLRVSLEDDPRGPEIEVDFLLPIERMDIRPATTRTKIIGLKQVPTGDVVFDAQMVVHAADPATITEFLTPLRRESILALNAAVMIEEIDDDELEVRLPSTEWTTSELVDAVQLVVQVAQILTGVTEPVPPAPQDAVPTAATPQDAVS